MLKSIIRHLIRRRSSPLMRAMAEQTIAAAVEDVKREAGSFQAMQLWMNQITSQTRNKGAVPTCMP